MSIKSTPREAGRLQGSIKPLPWLKILIDPMGNLDLREEVKANNLQAKNSSYNGGFKLVAHVCAWNS
jgi:hypothetical protein